MRRRLHRRLPIALLFLLTVVVPARAEDRRIRYDFDGKIVGSAAVPHSIYQGLLEDLDNPNSPKGKEVDDYKGVSEDSDDHQGVAAKAEARSHAAFLLLFKIEPEILEKLKTWKGLELDLSAQGGPEDALTGADLQVEVQGAGKKTWVALKNDMPEGWGHHFAIAGPYTPFAEHKGLVAIRVSCTKADAPNRVVLDFARLTLVMPGDAGGAGESLTYTSLPGHVKLTRPETPGWKFRDSDKALIELNKEGDAWVWIRVIKYEGSTNYRMPDGSKVSGDNAKALAEIDMGELEDLYKPKEKVEVQKTQFFAFKAFEFKFTGEDKKDGSLISIREIYIREKGNTFRLSVHAHPTAAKDDRLAIEKVLKSFAFTD